jgi:hypothetical protein
MIELEKRIDEWRRQMCARLPAEAVEELESHLREIVAECVASGLSEREAFGQAISRMGSVEKVSSEFEKRDESWWAIKAATVGALAIALGSSVFAVAIALQGGPIKWLLAVHVLAASTGYLGAFMVGALGICYVGQRLLWNFSPTGEVFAARAAVAFASAAAGLTAAAIVLGMVWAKLEWGRFWAWDYKETGALAILTWLLVFIGIGRGRAVAPRVIMTLAVLGNIVAIFGWFGAHYMQSGQWNSVHGAIILGGTMAHIIIATLAFAPAGKLDFRAR